MRKPLKPMREMANRVLEGVVRRVSIDTPDPVPVAGPGPGWDVTEQVLKQ